MFPNGLELHHNQILKSNTEYPEKKIIKNSKLLKKIFWQYIKRSISHEQIRVFLCDVETDLLISKISTSGIHHRDWFPWRKTLHKKYFVLIERCPPVKKNPRSLTPTVNNRGDQSTHSPTIITSVTKEDHRCLFNLTYLLQRSW